MTIFVYNTLSRKKEKFTTNIPGKVTIYVCGPTVYKLSHIGHMVGPVVFDTIKRFLTHQGYEVLFAINITDIDDKLIVEANRLDIPMKSLAETVSADYISCLHLLGVNSVNFFPKATDHILEITNMITTLIDKGNAYSSKGDVYFDVSSDRNYGKLCNRDPEQLEIGSRIEINDKKRNHGDFALWKTAKPNEPAWESPWGLGRPGWHIECSAMSMKWLGKTIDIHGGGLDLQFPHHENELAQSESYSGQLFARYWLHNGLMKTGEKKMAKSEGNEIVVRELLQRYTPETLRTLLLSSHYRSPIEFTEFRLDEIARSLEGFHRFFSRFERITAQSYFSLGNEQILNFEIFPPELINFRSRFISSMADDFNTGASLAVLFDLLNWLNKFIDCNRLEYDKLASKEHFISGTLLLRELSSLLGILELQPSPTLSINQSDLAYNLMKLIIELRAQARKNKDFSTADLIRNRLGELSVVLEDRHDGTGFQFG